MAYRWFLAVFFVVMTASAALAADKVVLFDQGHDQKFIIDKRGKLDLTTLAHVFIKQKWTARINAAPFTDSSLGDVDAVVISGAFYPVNPTETAALKRYVERGGALCVMLHIPSPVADLLHAFGVYVSNGVIRESKGGMDFKATRLATHPLTRGLRGVKIYGGWALLNEAPAAVGVAKTSDQAWVDLNGDKKFGHGDAKQAFDIIVAGTHGAGRFVFFGDDAIFQNQFLTGDNAKLAGNLSRWLKPAPADKGI